MARKNRGTHGGAPPKRIAELFLLARPSALRPVPQLYYQVLLVNNWLFFLAIYALAVGTNLFWRKLEHGA